MFARVGGQYENATRVPQPMVTMHIVVVHLSHVGFHPCHPTKSTSGQWLPIIYANLDGYMYRAYTHVQARHWPVASTP